MPTLRKSYRCCFVPQCKNTTKSTPDKIFFCVPNDDKTKKLWFKIVGRPGTPMKSTVFCCQDHFDIKEDMENYVRFSLTGGPIKLKSMAVPHIFECQPDPKRGSSRQSCSIAEKRRKAADIDDASSQTEPDRQENKENSSYAIGNDNQTPVNTADPQTMFNYFNCASEETEKHLNDTLPQPGCSSWTDSLDIDIKYETIKPELSFEEAEMPPAQEDLSVHEGDPLAQAGDPLAHEDISAQHEGQSLAPERVSLTHEKDPLANEGNLLIYKGDLAIHRGDLSTDRKDLSARQRYLSPHRIGNTLVNKGIQCNAVQNKNYESKEISCNLLDEQTIVSSPEVPRCADAATSTENTMPSLRLHENKCNCGAAMTATSFGTISQGELKSHTSQDKVEANDQQEIQGKSLTLTNCLIEQNSKEYIGISNELLWIIDFLKVHTKISSDDIKLTLMKIKLDDTFKRLGIQFGLADVRVQQIFFHTVVELADYLKSFICIAPKMSVKRLLPIPFRANYNNVGAIIDYFEIEIEKPLDYIEQALTWSEYKKCNTIKYLVSTTPDGTINYISTGYGGKISDTLLFEKCGIVDELPENCHVMANRGFKHMTSIFNRNNYQFIVFPSTTVTAISSQFDVVETQRIAGLRISIERIIKRLKEYKILVPGSYIPQSLVPFMDSAVVVAAALTNLQSPLLYGPT